MDPDLVRQQREEETLSKGGPGLNEPGRRSAETLPRMSQMEARSQMPDEKPVTPAWRDAATATAAPSHAPAAPAALPVLGLSAKAALLAFLGGLAGHAAGLAGAGAANLPPDQTLIAAGVASLLAALILAAATLARRMGGWLPALGTVSPGALICAGATIVASLRAPQLASLDPWSWGGVALAALGAIGLAWGLTYVRLRTWLTSR